MSTRRRLTAGFATLAVSAALTGAGAAGASSAGAGPAHLPAEQGCVQQVLSGMTTAQRVGQLFLVGVSSTDPTSAQLNMITDDHLGGVYLAGNSSAGVSATKRVTDELRARATSTNGTGLWVGTDQEGGQVQRLTGPGFSAMPSALEQGQVDPDALRSNAETWGGQLKEAGVNLNLAPVFGTVPEDVGTGNQPIGRYDREYGYTPDTVGSHGGAVVKGEQAAGVQTTAKHFPGLGRADGNTDTTAGVKDTVTTRDDPYVQPFQTAVTDGATLVMVSSAIYTKIDPGHIATFSPTVLRGMLRDDLGFDGVIITDSMAAAAVASVPVGDRALNFLDAGGTVILTGEGSDVPAMIDAVTTEAGSDSAFAAKVNAAAEHVLRAKNAAGLLTCDGTDHAVRSR